MANESQIVIYGNECCAYCAAARMLLARKGAKFEEVLVSRDAAKLDEMVQRSGQRSVPQIFVGDRLVGGFKELCALDDSGALDKLLAGNIVGEL
jgi:glutaredoxin 3